MEPVSIDTTKPHAAAGGPEPAADPASDHERIKQEWADEYPEGAELYCAVLSSTDFDPEYGEQYPDGTTLAIRRLAHRPSPGWIRRHAHLSDLERTFALIEQHASQRALDILDSLTEKAWDAFVQAWAVDGGLVDTGKSTRSARR